MRDAVPSPEARTVRWLIGYFGFFQTVHVLVNIRALARFHRGAETFPANPPAGGWSDETRATFQGMAGIDAVAGLVTIAFVVDRRRNGELWPWLGTVALTLANYSAVLYAFPTREAGAWREHPVSYWGLYIAYLPIVALSVLFVWWGVRGDL
jgi:hypothetical protein